jgi:hypothetical protein
MTLFDFVRYLINIIVHQVELRELALDLPGALVHQVEVAGVEICTASTAY